MCWYITSGVCFESSTDISSHPGDLLNFILDIAFLILSDVNGLDIFVGRRSDIGSTFFQNVSLKYFTMVFDCSILFVFTISGDDFFIRSIFFTA